MKGIVREFLKRGMLFAWGGPAVVAFVWLCLNRSGELTALSVGEAVLGIYSSTALAFVAAGITVVYQMEQLPKPICRSDSHGGAVCRLSGGLSAQWLDQAPGGCGVFAGFCVGLWNDLGGGVFDGPQKCVENEPVCPKGSINDGFIR